MEDLSKQIMDKAEVIAKILISGNSAELKRNTDGSLKVFDVGKKIVK